MPATDLANKAVHRPDGEGHLSGGTHATNLWQRWLGFENRNHALIACLAIVAGVAIRTLFNALRPRLGTVGEVVNVATALAHGHGFADAYQVGQGPTAHLLPIPPLFVGSIYSLLGPKTLPAEIVLASCSIGLTMIRYVIFNHIARLLGIAERTRICVFVLLCVFPIYISQESVDFRVWEGGLASFLLGVLLLVMLTSSGPMTGVRSFKLSAPAALLAFINPVIGLPAYASLGLFWLSRLSFAQVVRNGLLAALPLLLLFGPWVARNMMVMHSPILLRSNAGLERALATSPEYLDSKDPLDLYINKQMKKHPGGNPDAYAEMERVGGEVPYSRMMGEQASVWMQQHPGQYAQLVLLRLRQVIVPDPWMFRLANPLFARERAACVGIVNILALIAILLNTIRRRPGWIFMGVLVICFTLLFAPFQPIPRYIYITYPLMAFSAGELIAQLARTRQNASRPATA